ncbi:MAG: hypothetical protein JZU63_12735, partial [Rhodoferax sp.]|nr:hypothetical protein [Rhodoferax sp.]
TANSSFDRRDILAKDLATSLGAQTYYDSKGMMAVQLPGGLPLVQGNQAMSLTTVQNGQGLDLELSAGGVTRTIGLNNLGGEFYGLANIRDTVIPGLKDNLDQLAYGITTAVNTVHAAGAGLDSSQVAAATAPTPPATVATGDNRNALLIANLGKTALIGSDTFNSYYGKMSATVGIMSNQNQLSLGGAEDAMVQMQNLRDGLAGVS